MVVYTTGRVTPIVEADVNFKGLEALAATFYWIPVVILVFLILVVVYLVEKKFRKRR